VDTNATIGRQYGLVEAHPFKAMIETVGIIANSGFWTADGTYFVAL